MALSRRLRDALLALYEDRFGPSPGELVLEGLDADNFRRREWRRICARAKLGHRALKDLRDTFASQLFSAGVQLGYVSRQLGHADVTTTARHYAKWIEAEEYRAPLALLPGEIPADLLARLADCSQSAHNDGSESEGVSEFPEIAGSSGSGGWARTNDLRLMKPPL